MTPALIILIDLILFIGALLFLIKSTQILTHVLNELARLQKFRLFALVGFLSPLATALPELSVSVSGALQGDSSLALGVIMGSNIVDITLVAGLVALIGGSLSVAGDFVKKDVVRAFAVSLMPLAFIIDGQLSRLDGLLLIIGYWLYHLAVFHDKHALGIKPETQPFKHIGSWLHSFNKQYQKRQIEWFLFGTLLMVCSSMLVAALGSKLAADLNIPVLLFGIFIVAIGTSLPELVFEIQAARQRKAAMVFGNLLGSIVTNSTLTLGLVVMIRPFSSGIRQDSVLGTGVMFVISFLILWYFIKTKLKLQRWEGLVLIILYLLFCGLETLVL